MLKTILKLCDFWNHRYGMGDWACVFYLFALWIVKSNLDAVEQRGTNDQIQTKVQVQKQTVLMGGFHDAVP